MELFGNSGTPVGTLKDAEFKKLFDVILHFFFQKLILCFL
jgi:hypothetical protein